MKALTVSELHKLLSSVATEYPNVTVKLNGIGISSISLNRVIEKENDIFVERTYCYLSLNQ